MSASVAWLDRLGPSKYTSVLIDEVLPRSRRASPYEDPKLKGK
jgi:hypothetical protein